MKYVSVNKVRIYINPNLTIEQRKTVERSIRERLFSRPWRPLDRYKTVIDTKPYKDAMALNIDGIPALMMHPDTFDQFREQLPRGTTDEIESKFHKKEGILALEDDHDKRHRDCSQH